MNRFGHCAFTLGLWTNTHDNTAVANRYFALLINLLDNPPRFYVSKIPSALNSTAAGPLAKPKPKKEPTWSSHSVVMTEHQNRSGFGGPMLSSEANKPLSRFF